MSDFYISTVNPFVVENLHPKFNHLGNISQSLDGTEITLSKINFIKNLDFKRFYTSGFFFIYYGLEGHQNKRSP